MKVLVVHNHYRSTSPSGEDVVVRNELELLRRHGVEVVTWERRNDAIGEGALALLATGAGTIWSRAAQRELRALVARERPDVAHFHNLWYLISPSAYEPCREAGVPVVQTLHNYRSFCANGLLLRDGRACEDCVGRVPWRGLAHGCFRSRLHSLPVVAAEAFHRLRGTWETRVDAFIALSGFARELFVRCGLPRERIHVKPNFFAGEVPAEVPRSGHGIFLGRLSEEKGVATLLEAAALSGVPLKIVGDGPLRPQLEQLARSRGLRDVEFLGRRDGAESVRLLAGASFLALPSICYENFPMSIVEAFACGTPVVASRLGAPAELVEEGRTGLLFEPGNAADLASKLSWLAAHAQERAAMGANARAAFGARYSPGDNARMLLEIYRLAGR